MAVLGVVVFVLVSFWNGYRVSGCSCRLPNRQEQFCNPDTYAIRGTIESRWDAHVETDGTTPSYFPHKVYYEVRIEEAFKELPPDVVFDYNGLLYTIIETGSESSMCGVPFLSVGYSYEFIGSMPGLYSDYFRLDLCNVFGIWDDLNAYVKSYYRDGFYGCECELEPNLIPTGDGDPDVCYGPSGREAVCRKEDDVCIWWTPEALP